MTIIASYTCMRKKNPKQLDPWCKVFVTIEYQYMYTRHQRKTLHPYHKPQCMYNKQYINYISNYDFSIRFKTNTIPGFLSYFIIFIIMFFK